MSWTQKWKKQAQERNRKQEVHNQNALEKGIVVRKGKSAIEIRTIRFRNWIPSLIVLVGLVFIAIVSIHESGEWIQLTLKACLLLKPLAFLKLATVLIPGLMFAYAAYWPARGLLEEITVRVDSKGLTLARNWYFTNHRKRYEWSEIRDLGIEYVGRYKHHNVITGAYSVVAKAKGERLTLVARTSEKKAKNILSAIEARRV